jgi:hypothetical protein
MFQFIKKDKNTKARLGKLTTAHGEIDSPFFMPVGTNGTVKTLSFESLLEFDTQIVLSNTYHLFLRPGLDVIARPWSEVPDSWESIVVISIDSTKDTSTATRSGLAATLPLPRNTLASANQIDRHRRLY